MNLRWLLFKHDFHYLLDDWVRLYIDVLWIFVVNCEVWFELRSYGAFGEKWVWWWKLDDWMLWIHISMHPNVPCMYFNCWWSFCNAFGSIGMLGKILCEFPRGTQKFGLPVLWHSPNELIFAVARDITHSIGRSGQLGSLLDIPKCSFWCVYFS